MKEAVLHYIWQNKLFANTGLFTTDGQSVEIVDVGKLNSDGGPDFFNVKIRIGETLWAGNAEIHLQSSDWYRHGHHLDPAYDNVILHIVKQDDMNIKNSLGFLIPQLVLCYDKAIEHNYLQLLESSKWIACFDGVSQVNDYFVNEFKTSLVFARLELRVSELKENLRQNNNLWEETFLRLLARSFGFDVNKDAFHALIKTIPWSVMQKCRQSRFTTEALLFGQAGLLENEKDVHDQYYQDLREEYAFIQKKFRLRAISPNQWKMLRMRPENFPQIRLSQLASLIFQHEKLFSEIIACQDTDQIIKLFSNIECTDYWKNHYVFSKLTSSRKGIPGKSTIYLLIINAVVPALYAFGELRNNQLYKDNAVELLENLPPERNKIINNWQNAGIKVTNAFDSQAFIHLYKNYCLEKKCLICRIGHQVLSKCATK